MLSSSRGGHRRRAQQPWGSGAAEAGDAFIRRYFDLLWRCFCNEVDGDTEALVQNTLVACVKHRDKLGQADDVRAYVLMIARNELLMHLRRVYKRPIAIDPADVSIFDFGVGACMTETYGYAIMDAGG